ncbi:fimbrial protein [Salmonella enterica subsp. enterica serovar Infantis]|nr:fimbrial protein [Salmonella enterica subsp. enterica serovar Infantis]HBJ0125520.1 fimbrial protein [Escherichia coli]HBJ1132427.1 fimbrial protein [Escherichia coli]
MKKISLTVLSAVFLISASAVQAAEVAHNLQFSGNLIIPDCTVNEGNPIKTEWKDVAIQTLGSASAPSHEQALRIPVKCPYSLGTPKMTLKGNFTSVAGKQGLQTSKNSEGLLIFLRTKTPGSWITSETMQIPDDSITGDSADKILTMYAALGYSKRMEDLTPGEFSAGATLEMRYE